MASPTFSGQLSLVDFTVDEVARIDPKSQFDPATSTTIYQIEGLLKDNMEETYELCVWIQHSVHRFHDEDWNFITFAGGSRDTIPGTQKFGKGRKVQGGFTCVHQTRKDEYAIDPRMSQFKLGLFDKNGRRKFTTTPFNHDVWWSYVHENSTVLFVDSKPSAYIHSLSLCSMREESFHVMTAVSIKLGAINMKRSFHHSADDELFNFISCFSQRQF